MASLASGLFTGCYTQLYTRGYAERTSVNREYSRATGTPSGSTDPAAPDTGTVGDSGVAAARERDTLNAPPTAVVVNNYYRESPYYRGYLINDWDYPSFTFGIYSSRYRDYSSPFWWNDPWYRAGGGYHTGYHGGRGSHGGGYRGDNGGSIPSTGGGTTGPYQSDKRIFTPEPDHPELRKGRRSNEAPAADPAPKYSGESESSSSSSSASSSASTSTSSSTSTSGSAGSSSSSGSSDDDDHPTLKKGRRR
ncbi:MAG: hypothetical protein ABIW76_17640 [Fibrobacteria bacterium]